MQTESSKKVEVDRNTLAYIEYVKEKQGEAETEYRLKKHAAPGPEGYGYSDTGNADRLTHMYMDDLRYCYTWKKWLVWNLKYWQPDDKGLIKRHAKEVVKAIYGEAGIIDDEEKRKLCVKHARASESDLKIKAMLSLSECELAILADKLDRDKYLLNCLNGTVNLKTGHLQPHSRDDYISKAIPVEYNSDAYPGKWLAFLDKIMDGNKELISFLQRAVGYSLTGDTSEQCLFFLHGAGSNGKSTFLSVIQTLLAAYALKTDFETFLHQKNPGIRNDLARLAGAVRFVSATESGRGKILSETVVKELCGQDLITSRKLYQEFTEFRPEFKIWWGANSKPVIREGTLAIWRRIRLVPFTVTILPEEQNPNLTSELIEELPGILNWAVLGCLDWQEKRLAPPAEVLEATSAYKTEMDRLGPFVEDRCNEGIDCKIEKAELFKEYEDWCSENGEEAMSKKAFTLSLREKGMKEIKTGSRRLWKGISLETKE